MTRITLDDVLRSKLLDLGEPIELCDESGRLVARVLPVHDLSEYELWEPTFTEEELRQMEESNEKRYSTDEVLKHLESL